MNKAEGIVIPIPQVTREARVIVAHFSEKSLVLVSIEQCGQIADDANIRKAKGGTYKCGSSRGCMAGEEPIHVQKEVVIGILQTELVGNVRNR